MKNKKADRKAKLLIITVVVLWGTTIIILATNFFKILA
jgi:hypothetical protein